MSSSWGTDLRLSIFGESHSAAIGAVLDGLPAGEPIDWEELLRFMARRRSQGGKTDTPRREADLPQIQSGLLDGVTTGTPLCAVIPNANTRSQDYDQLRHLARPGHADYTGFLRYGGHADVRGGGHFSGRLTAPLVFAGGVCRQILARRGIVIGAHIAAAAGIPDTPFDPVLVNAGQLASVTAKPFPVLDDAAGEAMVAAIDQARLAQDSVGGIIECAVVGLPGGLGSPMFDGVENRLASLLFGIPAVKGLEFGGGFSLAGMRGSQSNDPFVMENGQIRTTQNHNGGILGGITNGMPLVFRVAVKPTPSISQPQQTVDFLQKQDATLTIQGRHDPCIVRRAVPCMEAAAALALLDLLLGSNGPSLSDLPLGEEATL